MHDLDLLSKIEHARLFVDHLGRGRGGHDGEGAQGDRAERVPGKCVSRVEQSVL